MRESSAPFFHAKLTADFSCSIHYRALHVCSAFTTLLTKESWNCFPRFFVNGKPFMRVNECFFFFFLAWRRKVVSSHYEKCACFFGYKFRRDVVATDNFLPLKSELLGWVLLEKLGCRRTASNLLEKLPVSWTMIATDA